MKFHCSVIWSLLDSRNIGFQISCIQSVYSPILGPHHVIGICDERGKPERTLFQPHFDQYTVLLAGVLIIPGDHK